jgi:hypothetical protein
VLLHLAAAAGVVAGLLGWGSLAVLGLTALLAASSRAVLVAFAVRLATEHG